MWIYSHVSKKRYGQLKTAEKALERMVASGFKLRHELEIYPCRWTDLFEAPPAGKLHYHLGHPRAQERKKP
jgi:hypothetical protein